VGTAWVRGYSGILLCDMLEVENTSRTTIGSTRRFAIVEVHAAS
jgi:hypothetical protein